MPIEFAPPAPNLQGFQIPAAQYTDPLQTLSQMGQLRNQNLQAQAAQMQIQQEQIKLRDLNGMRAAMQQWDGKNPDDLFTAARQNGVSPTTLLDMQNKLLAHQEAMQKLDTETVTNAKAHNKRLSSLLAPVEKETDPGEQENLWNDAIAQGVKQGDIKAADVAQFAYPGPEGVKKRRVSLDYEQYLLEQKSEQEIAASQETARKTKLENQKADREQAAQEIQAAIDPATGVPSPADWARIQKAHPQVTLPDMPTPGSVQQFTRAAVPVEKQPEYDINSMKAKLGLMGNTEFDQYMVQYARSQGLTPATLQPAQWIAGATKYNREVTKDPMMEAMLLQMRTSQLAMEKTQLAAVPTKEQIHSMGVDLYNGDMSPDELSLIKQRSINDANQIIDEARKEGIAKGKPFSLANAEIAYRTRQKTEEAFARGPEAQMVRSFDNLIAHTGMMWDARKALSSSDLPTIKAIAGALGVATGGTAETTYDLIADYVANEAAKAFLPTGGGEAERAKNYSHFQRNLGDAQLQSNIKGLMSLADAQREGLERQYSQGTQGKGLQMGTLFSKQALQARDELMGKKTSTVPKGFRINRNGKTYEFTGTGDSRDLKNYNEVK